MPKYTDAEALTILQDRKTQSENFMRPNWDLFLEIYSLYICYTQNYSQILAGNRANIFVPYVFQKIETKIPRIIQAMVGSEDWFKVVGVGDEDDANAKYHDKLMKYQFANEIDTLWFFITWYKECMLYGNSFAGVFYEKEVRDIKARTPKYTDDSGNNLYPYIMGYDFKPTKKTVYDGVVLTPLDIFDCYPDPKGTRVNGLRHESMHYFIVRSEPSASYLKGIADNPEIAEMHGFNPQAIKKLLKDKPQGTHIADPNRTERMGYRGLTEVGIDDTHNPHYEMFTMWEDDCVVSTIENDVIRNCGQDKFPFYEMRKPIVMALDTPVPHELFALGQIKPILRLNYYAQDLENAKMDSILDYVYPGYFANIEQIDKGYFATLQNNMRGLHPCIGNADTVIRPIQKVDHSTTATNEQLNVERLINNALGSGDLQAGGGSTPGSQTATEINEQIQQANYRFDLSVRLLKDFSHKELLMMMIDRNTQYAPDEKLIRIMNEDGTVIRESIKPENLIGNFDVRVKTSPIMGNKLAYAQNLMRFLDVLAKTGGMYPELVKQIGVALGIDDASQFIVDKAQQATQIIVQAAQEGLLQNGQQSALVLKAVLDVLAPPPPGQGAIPGQQPQAQDTTDIVRQEAQMGR